MKWGSFLLCFLWIQIGLAEEPQSHREGLDEYQKRYRFNVVKNRFFEKKWRPEVSLYSNILMNRSFVYSVFWTLELAYHFSEYLGLQLEASRASTINRSACEVIGSSFLIEPIVDKLIWFVGGGLNLTPTYGKYLLSSGKVIYTDIFFKGSGGVGSAIRRNSSCIPGSKGDDEAASTFYLSAQIGQRFFLDRSLSFNWGGGGQWYRKPGVDTFEIDELITNILLGMGLSFFF
jgi:outer membrane beta-barrel protein